MITFLTTVFVILIGVAMKAFALPIVKRIVIGWTHFYPAIASEQGEARRDEVLSDMHEQITADRNEGYPPHEIALHIFLRLVIGLRDDVAWCAPFVPPMIVDKTSRFSEALSSFRTPKQLIPSLATLGIMNWAFFNSHSGWTWAQWFCLNSVTIAMIVLMWKQHHPQARRIFYAWIGTATVVIISLMVWFTYHYHLYDLPIFQTYMLAITAIALAMLVTGKSFRIRLFRGRWQLVIISWVLIIALSLAASWVLTGNIVPLLTAWAMIALLITSLILLVAVFALITAAVWHSGLRGTAAGLRLMAIGIRRLR